LRTRLEKRGLGRVTGREEKVKKINWWRERPSFGRGRGVNAKGIPNIHSHLHQWGKGVLWRKLVCVGEENMFFRP